MWSEHCSLQELPAAPADAADRPAPSVVAGPGENAGVIDRRRPGGRLQDRIAQPSLGGRAIPGCRHRRRRDPPRHLHDGCPANRDPRRPPLRRPGRRADAPPSARRGSRRGRLRQLRRRPTVGGELVFDPSYAGNPLVNVMAIGLLPAGRLTLAQAPGPGNLAILFGSTDRSRRDRWRLGPGQRDLRR